MPEMQIEEVINEKDVVDYDFSFIGGQRLTFIVDEAAGDKVAQAEDSYILDFAGKPSFIDPEELMDAEVITVFKRNLAAVAIRNRKQRMPTAEEVFNARKTLHELAKSVQ